MESRIVGLWVPKSIQINYGIWDLNGFFEALDPAGLSGARFGVSGRVTATELLLQKGM